MPRNAHMRNKKNLCAFIMANLFSVQYFSALIPYPLIPIISINLIDLLPEYTQQLSLHSPLDLCKSISPHG